MTTNDQTADRRRLYGEIEPYAGGRLKVSDIHELHYEEAGSPDGKPVVFLHGGPGGGIEPDHRRYFDPEAYRVVLFDQRIFPRLGQRSAQPSTDPTPPDQHIHPPQNLTT